MKIQKILNPVDGSEHAIHATSHAIELARVFRAKVVLMHCHDKYPIVLAEPYFQEAVNKINKEAEKLIAPFISLLEDEDVRFDIRILEGPPGIRIPEVARIEKIDMIVMGSRGATDFEGLLLGSVAHQVLHRAQCPVYITK